VQKGHVVTPPKRQGNQKWKKRGTVEGSKYFSSTTRWKGSPRGTMGRGRKKPKKLRVGGQTGVGNPKRSPERVKAEKTKGTQGLYTSTGSAQKKKNKVKAGRETRRGGREKTFATQSAHEKNNTKWRAERGRQNLKMTHPDPYKSIRFAAKAKSRAGSQKQKSSQQL